MDHAEEYDSQMKTNLILESFPLNTKLCAKIRQKVWKFRREGGGG